MDVEDVVERRAWSEVWDLPTPELDHFVSGLLDGYVDGSPIIHPERLLSVGVAMSRWDRPMAALLLSALDRQLTAERFIAVCLLLAGLWSPGTTDPPDDAAVRRLLAAARVTITADATAAFALADALTAAAGSTPSVVSVIADAGRPLLRQATRSLPPAQAGLVMSRLRLPR